MPAAPEATEAPVALEDPIIADETPIISDETP
jgi:hypothetical protein